jgi:hypothetical protein
VAGREGDPWAMSELGREGDPWVMSELDIKRDGSTVIYKHEGEVFLELCYEKMKAKQRCDALNGGWGYFELLVIDGALKARQVGDSCPGNILVVASLLQEYYETWVIEKEILGV